MKSTLKQLSPNISIDKIQESDDVIYVYCHQKNRSTICPKCNEKISSVHSIHSRKIQDLPVQGKTVFLIPKVRHFHCRKCNLIFTEDLEYASKTAHKTKRLTELILDHSCSISSLTSQSTLNKQGVIVKKSTICAYQKKRCT